MIIRIGFGGILYYDESKERPPNSIANYEGLYIDKHERDV